MRVSPTVKRPQDQGAVRDRLVAGHAYSPVQGAAGTGFSGVGVANGPRLCPLRGAAVSHGPMTSRGRQMRQIAIDSSPSSRQVQPVISEIPRTSKRGKARARYQARLPGDGPQVLRPEQESGDLALYRRGGADRADCAAARPPVAMPQAPPPPLRPPELRDAGGRRGRRVGFAGRRRRRGETGKKAEVPDAEDDEIERSRTMTTTFRPSSRTRKKAMMT